MNQQERIIHSARHIRNIKRIEQMFVDKLHSAMMGIVKEFVAVLEKEGIQSARRSIDHIVIDSGFIEIIRMLHITVGIYSANLTLLQILKSAKPVRKPEIKRIRDRVAGFGFDEEFFQEIVNFFRLYLLNKAVLPYTQSVRNLIRDLLEEGIREGLGVRDITNLILERADLERYRAERIVRTEAQFAMQYGRRLGQNKSRWQTESEWISAHDLRTRHSHRDVDGKKVDEGKRFRVPIYEKGGIVGYDFMLGPGDITASAGNVINCRCTMVTTAKRDKNGRLILKTLENSNISVILPSEVFNPHTTITI